MMKKKDLNEKIRLLKAGQIVEISGDYFRACRIPEGACFVACDICDLDSVCRGNVIDVCVELDKPFGNEWILKLAHK